MGVMWLLFGSLPARAALSASLWKIPHPLAKWQLVVSLPVVLNLFQSCFKVVSELFQSCLKVVWKLYQNCFKVVLKLSLSERSPTLLQSGNLLCPSFTQLPSFFVFWRIIVHIVHILHILCIWRMWRVQKTPPNSKIFLHIMTLVWVLHFQMESNVPKSQPIQNWLHFEVQDYLDQKKASLLINSKWSVNRSIPAQAIQTKSLMPRCDAIFTSGMLGFRMHCSPLICWDQTELLFSQLFLFVKSDIRIQIVGRWHFLVQFTFQLTTSG